MCWPCDCNIIPVPVATGYYVPTARPVPNASGWRMPFAPAPERPFGSPPFGTSLWLQGRATQGYVAPVVIGDNFNRRVPSFPSSSSAFRPLPASRVSHTPTTRNGNVLPGTAANRR